MDPQTDHELGCLRARLVSMRKPGLVSECWPWPGPTNNAGYGVLVYYMGEGRRRCTTASRAALIAAKGLPPSPEHEAMHSCDNPPCTNPAHLSWGLPLANTADMWAKGRGHTGQRQPETKPRHRGMTDDQVRAIRGDTRDARDIAKDYGISCLSVYNIKARRRKALVPD